LRLDLSLLPRRQSRHRAQHRHSEFVEGEDGAGRKARQHYDRLLARDREAKRLAGLQRHAMHENARRGQRGQDAMRDIARALARAARHHDHVGARQCIAQRRCEHVRIVPEDAHRQRLAAILADRGAEDRGVAVGDAPGRQGRAGRVQLVAGRDHGHDRAAHHRHLAPARGGQHADLAAGDLRTGPQ
jgi:hypothetical protein